MKHAEGNDSRKGRAATRPVWFRNIASLPELDDRVWDARLIGDRADGNRTVIHQLAAELPIQGLGVGEDEGGGRGREKRAGMGLVALALAHNSVEVRVQQHLTS